MVMVDSQNAYKVMAFLFLMAGVSVQRSILESRGRTSAVDLREAD
jgi:hypothetical protein